MVYIHSTHAQSLSSSNFGNSTATSCDGWSIFYNPAGALWQKNSFASAYYNLHPYINELDLKAAGYANRSSNRLYAISLFQQGDHRLNLKEVNVTYGQLFKPSLSMAASMHYRNYSFGDVYGQRNVLFFSFGAQLNLNSKERLAFCIKNPSQQHVDRKNNERLESIFSIAYQYQFSSLFTMSAALEKQSNQGSNFRVCWQYNIKSKFNIQGGYETLFRRYKLSLEFEINDLSLSHCIMYDAILGAQIGLGMCYYISKND